MQKKITEAQKKEALTPKPPYLKIRIAYNATFIFKYKDGIAFLDSLEKAEQINTNMYDHPIIEPLYIDIETQVIPTDVYVKNKMDQLLGLPTEKF
jgi:hypothetical protein